MIDAAVRKIFVVVILLTVASPASTAESEKEIQAAAMQALSVDARSIVKRFGGKLKPRLLAAIESGGFDHAVKICAVEAPQIAKALSDETGWSVKRVSLKPRNKSSASADRFEQKVLNTFNERQRFGSPAAALSHAEIIEGDFRFLQAQGVEGLCLNCHGSELSPRAAKALEVYYPDDIATGYALGEIRGAFSLTKAQHSEGKQ